MYYHIKPKENFERDAFNNAIDRHIAFYAGNILIPTEILNMSAKKAGMINLQLSDVELVLVSQELTGKIKTILETLGTIIKKYPYLNIYIDADTQWRIRLNRDEQLTLTYDGVDDKIDHSIVAFANISDNSIRRVCVEQSGYLGLAQIDWSCEWDKEDEENGWWYDAKHITVDTY